MHPTVRLTYHSFSRVYRPKMNGLRSRSDKFSWSQRYILHFWPVPNERPKLDISPETDMQFNAFWTRMNYGLFICCRPNPVELVNDQPFIKKIVLQRLDPKAILSTRLCIHPLYFHSSSTISNIHLVESRPPYF